MSAADAGDQVTLDSAGLEVTVAQLLTLIDIAETIAQKYDVVVTNPPYMQSATAMHDLMNMSRKTTLTAKPTCLQYLSSVAVQ